MRALVLVYIIEAVGRTCAEHTSRVVLVNTWARSCAEAVQRNLLVAYQAIDIRANMIFLAYPQLLRDKKKLSKMEWRCLTHLH